MLRQELTIIIKTVMLLERLGINYCQISSSSFSLLYFSIILNFLRIA